MNYVVTLIIIYARYEIVIIILSSFFSLFKKMSKYSDSKIVTMQNNLPACLNIYTLLSCFFNVYIFRNFNYAQYHICLNEYIIFCV